MKNPESSQAKSGFMGEQLYLIDPPPFSPSFPTQSSLTGLALKMLLQGQAITTLDFQKTTHSWRLAAYVEQLINKHRWPILTEEIRFSTDPRRIIASYSMPKWVILEIGEALNG
jgi:hypothetical protein